MLDLESLKEDDVVTIGSKTKDFLGNTLVNEYMITKSENGFKISYSKIGSRNQKFNSVIEVDKIISRINNAERRPELLNFICKNSDISAVTINDEFKVNINNIIYFEVHTEEKVKEKEVNNGTEN